MRDISPARLDALNRGEAETATLVEQLAVDLPLLVAHLGSWPHDHAALLAQLKTANIASLGVIARLHGIARLMLGQGAAPGSPGFDLLAGHRSDSLRSIACFIIGDAEGLDLATRLTLLRPFAADLHSGVREWAWIAVRPWVIAEPMRAILVLQNAVQDADANVRRFAIELTRPRGVWCAHLPLFKEQPELALPLLAPCRNDPARYVQLSLGNWLNDAGKHRPDWVRQLCADWQQQPDLTTAGRYILKRALRNL